LHVRRHLTQVVQAVAKAEFHLRQTLETMAADVLVGDANAPMSLPRFLTDMAG
jgi:hypothetical protein